MQRHGEWSPTRLHFSRHDAGELLGRREARRRLVELLEQLPRRAQLRLTWAGAVVHAVFMRRACGGHAVYIHMRCACGVHAVCMRCGVHAAQPHRPSRPRVPPPRPPVRAGASRRVPPCAAAPQGGRARTATLPRPDPPSGTRRGQQRRTVDPRGWRLHAWGCSL
eukprot:scaffold1078_cov69-Phaeocystis_antarctica.AAC.7